MIKLRKRAAGAILLAMTVTISVPGISALAEGGGQSPVVTIEEDGVPLSARMPSASGAVTFSGGGATIDASNTSNGYLMVKYSGGKIGRASCRERVCQYV